MGAELLQKGARKLSKLRKKKGEQSMLSLIVGGSVRYQQSLVDALTTALFDTEETHREEPLADGYVCLCVCLSLCVSLCVSRRAPLYCWSRLSFSGAGMRPPRGVCGMGGRRTQRPQEKTLRQQRSWLMRCGTV